MRKLTQNGKAGKVYWQDDNLIHAEDQWQSLGEAIATEVDRLMFKAHGGSFPDIDTPLCPACYMLILYNAAVTLAERNGQSLSELKETMAKLFSDMDPANPHTDSLTVICEVPEYDISQAADVLDEAYFQMEAVEHAMAELIAADNEYDGATIELAMANLAKREGRGDEVRMTKAVSRMASADLRRAKALARVQGVPHDSGMDGG